MLALRWEDIDFDARVIRVRGTLARVAGELAVSEPKTEKSRRPIYMTEANERILRAIRRAQLEAQLLAGTKWQKSTYVFTTELGALRDPRNALRAITTGARKAGLEGVGVHTLRHSAAPTMLAAGVPLKVVSEVLGHSSVAITGDIYGHVSPAVSASAMEVLSTALGYWMSTMDVSPAPR